MRVYLNCSAFAAAHLEAKSRALRASRNRWSMNHADFWVTPRSRAISYDETPFLQFTKSQRAGSHFLSKIGESSKIELTLTENCLRQERHFHRF
jgi:hypothetical protein